MYYVHIVTNATCTLMYDLCRCCAVGDFARAVCHEEYIECEEALGGECVQV